MNANQRRRLRELEANNGTNKTKEEEAHRPHSQQIESKVLEGSGPIMQIMNQKTFQQKANLNNANPEHLKQSKQPQQQQPQFQQQQPKQVPGNKKRAQQNALLKKAQQNQINTSYPNSIDEEFDKIEELEKMIKMFNLNISNDDNLWIENNNHYYSSQLEIEDIKKTVQEAEKEIEDLKKQRIENQSIYVRDINKYEKELERLILLNTIDLKKKNQLIQDDIDLLTKKIVMESDLLKQEEKDNNILIQELFPIEANLEKEINDCKELKLGFSELKESDGFPIDLLKRIDFFLGKKSAHDE